MPLQSREAQDDGGIRSAEDNLKTWNCLNCRRRKVRCDRRQPCASCIKNKAECIFPISGRAPRRSPSAILPKPPRQKQAILLGRLKRLEAMIGDLSSQVEHVGTLSYDDPQSQTSTGADSSDASRQGHQLTTPGGETPNGIPGAMPERVPTGSGKTNSTMQSTQTSEDFNDLAIDSHGDLVVGNRFWTMFCTEVEDIFAAVHGHTVMHLDEHDGSSATSSSTTQHHRGYYNFLLRTASSAPKQEDLRPLPSQMLFLWQAYMDNVDPFVKILHTPTISRAIREIKSSYSSLCVSMQALVMAIALAATMSLENEAILVNFNIEKSRLIYRYRLGTEQALEQADIVNHPNVTGLQALTLYLSVLQHTGSRRPAWTLAGVLIRLAAALKIHLEDPRIRDLSPFDMEMRRRLWWQICFLDSRSEDVHVSKYKLTEDHFEIGLPVNTDDENLAPGISILPNSDAEWTGMTVFLIHCEFWKLSRRLQTIANATSVSHTNIEQTLELFQRSKKLVEDTYLKHLDPNQPLQAFVATAAGLFLCNVSLVLHIRQSSAIVTESHASDALHMDSVFTSSLLVLEYTYALQNETEWKGWTWQVQSRYPPWHALRTVLEQLRFRPWSPMWQRAWSSAQRSLDTLHGAFKEDPRYQQLTLLAHAVQRSRANEPRRTPLVSNDLNSTDASTLHTAFAQSDAADTLATSLAQDRSTEMTDSFENMFVDAQDLDIDWQGWDELAGDFIPSLDLWDVGSF